MKTVTIDLNDLRTASLLYLKSFLVENELFTQAQVVKNFIDDRPSAISPIATPARKTIDL